MSDMVYLLSMTHAGTDSEGGCIWVADDDAAIAPTSKMGHAKAFETELDASAWRSDQNLILQFQITPIKAARYFKAKLKGSL